MSVSVNFHDAAKMVAEAHDHGDFAILKISDSRGTAVTLFLPLIQAVAMADAFSNPGRIKQLTDFIADFSEAKFEAIRSPGWVSPEDVEDDVTDLLTVEAWQKDAAALITPQKPVAQEAAA